jgi:hypothetical protein
LRVYTQKFDLFLRLSTILIGPFQKSSIQTFDTPNRYVLVFPCGLERYIYIYHTKLELWAKDNGRSAVLFGTIQGTNWECSKEPLKTHWEHAENNMKRIGNTKIPENLHPLKIPFFTLYDGTL